MLDRGTNFSMSSSLVLSILTESSSSLAKSNVLVLRDLKPLHQVGALDLLAGAGVDRHHVDAVVGLGNNPVEANGLRFRRRCPQRDRTGQQGQAQVAFPARSRSH
jgi:hypothetical protein